MKLTYQLLHSAGTNGIGFNYHQLKLLGVKWPPPRGWLTKMIGTDFDDDKWETIMRLKGRRRAERKSILGQSEFDIRNAPRKHEVEKERLEWLDLLNYVRDYVTGEVAAYGECHCDVPSGDCPCPYCASIHFNEAFDKIKNPSNQ